MKLGYREIGNFYYDKTVDITDPCYDDDVWCRMKANVKSGEYICAINIEDCSEWGERVSRIAICHNTYAPDNIFDLIYSHIGDIGVDAGLAGFFNNKPNYSDEEWLRLCDTDFLRSDCGIIDCGFWSSSGFGDGSYDVFACYDNNEIVALKIEFI